MNVSITSETNMEEFASFGSPRPSVQKNGLIATGAYNVVRAVRGLPDRSRFVANVQLPSIQLRSSIIFRGLSVNNLREPIHRG